MRVYLDSCIIIYAIEGASAIQAAATNQLAAVETDPDGILLTSRLPWLECRVKPLRDGDADLLTLFDDFFSRPRLQIHEVSAAIVERATDLRVKYNVKTPDALHLAAAIELKADYFLTGDAALSRCTDVPVRVV